MGKKRFGFAAALVFMIALVCPSSFARLGDAGVVAGAWAASEDFSYHDDEIMDHFAHGEDEEHFAHLNGMMVQLWKEQKRFFEAKGKGENTVADEVEGLINDTNLAASEGNYHEAYATLKKAHDLLVASFTEMGIKNAVK